MGVRTGRVATLIALKQNTTKTLIDTDPLTIKPTEEMLVFFSQTCSRVILHNKALKKYLKTKEFASYLLVTN